MNRIVVLVLVAIGMALVSGSVFFASASAIDVTYTSSGSPGEYLLNFTVVNGTSAAYNHSVYFLGVDLPKNPPQGYPTGWDDQGGVNWNTSWTPGGQNIFFPSNWYTDPQGSAVIVSGGSQSGFTVRVDSIPGTIHWFAYTRGVNPYMGSDAFYTGTTAAFQGLSSNPLPVVASAVPLPAPVFFFIPGLLGLIGIRRKFLG
jgi:hypothetical protein